jgi:DNA repair protein RAD50
LKGSYRYVKSKKTKALEDCSAVLQESEARSKDLHAQIEEVRREIAAIDKEINESGATMSNLRDNIIVRKLKEKMETIDRNIASYDMEEAAKARRNYEDKYQPAKAKEQKLNEVVCSLYPFGTTSFFYKKKIPS